MKKKIKYIIAFIILLSIFPCVFLFEELKLPTLYEESYYAMLPKLYKNLENTQGHKIVVIGGSSVAFGLDSELMEQLLNENGYDYSVCPFGLYAAIGSAAMLDLSIDTLNEGDIVILAFEPVSDAMTTYFGATAFLKAMESTPSLITKLDKVRLGSVIGNYPDYVKERHSIVESGNYPKTDGVYAVASFNEKGNMIFKRLGNEMAIGYDVSSPISLSDATLSEDFSILVNDYIKTADQKGATVYYSFCPMNKSAISDYSNESTKKYFDMINGSLNCQIISDPNNYVMESGWFYDSNFHLNTAGATLRTLQLTKDILAELGCYEALSYSIPKMPDSIPVVITENEYTDFFIYKESENKDYYIVTELTNEGRMETSLTIPSSYEGKPVLEVSPTLLQDCNAIEIRIPSSIANIPDYFFTYCDSIERIILEHTDTPIRLSDNSMDNASDIKIFVPSASYPLYRDGVGCEANQWTKYLSQIYTY